MTSRLARSLEKNRAEGWHCWKVEVWNQWARKRQDLFGMFDLLCIHPTIGHIKGTQVTDMAQMEAHIEKIKSNPLWVVWKDCGGLIEVEGWDKRCKDGRGTRKEWQCRTTVL